jgi:glucose-6-phosphate isomerase
MSVIRPRPPEEPLAYQVAGELAEAARLAAIRDALVAAPAGVGRASLLLAEYDARRSASELFAILGAARRIRDAVDRLVVVAGGGLGPATRLLAATCCHPFHDQLPRGERGGRPRLSWLDGATGNDEFQGLLDLVTRAGPRADDLLDRWAVLAVDSPSDDPRQAALVEMLLDSLAATTGGDPLGLAARVVTVAAPGGLLAAAVARRACSPSFTAGDEPGSPQDVFTAGGLLPAAVIGIDVVRVLKGAAAMFRRFAEAPVGENPPLLDAFVARHAATTGRPGRVFAGPGPWLGELSAWHASLRPAPLGAAAAVTIVTPGEPRRDRLPGLLSAAAPGGVLPPSREAAVPVIAHGLPADLPSGGANGEPPVVADVRIGLPRLDEHAVGQLLQLLILSAAVERRLRQTV